MKFCPYCVTRALVVNQNCCDACQMEAELAIEKMTSGK